MTSTIFNILLVVIVLLLILIIITINNLALKREMKEIKERKTLIEPDKELKIINLSLLNKTTHLDKYEQRYYSGSIYVVSYLFDDVNEDFLPYGGKNAVLKFENIDDVNKVISLIEDNFVDNFSYGFKSHTKDSLDSTIKSLKNFLENDYTGYMTIDLDNKLFSNRDHKYAISFNFETKIRSDMTNKTGAVNVESE